MKNSMSITTPWTSPPQDWRSSLKPGSVHVWRTPLDHSPERALRFRPSLSADEGVRADRCRTPHPQYEFVVTRGILRSLLSRYMGVPSTELQFATQSHGKPMLMRPTPHSLQFNVSHTRGMALLAVTLQHAVGIDVEWTDRKVQDSAITQRYFSAKESAYLASQAPSERTAQFFSFWTCKEAYLKMQGKGIGEGLAHCELSIEPDQPEVRLSLQDQQGPTAACSLYRITAGPEHIGAIALACPSTQISYWDWQDAYLL